MSLLDELNPPCPRGCGRSMDDCHESEDGGECEGGELFREKERLTAELARVEGLLDASLTKRDKLSNELREVGASAAQIRGELAEAKRKLDNLRGVKIWTNEDDRKFAFADDLAVALEWKDAPSSSDTAADTETSDERYPTVWAYEQACKAVIKHRDRAEALASAMGEIRDRANDAEMSALATAVYDMAVEAVAADVEARNTMPPHRFVAMPASSVGSCAWCFRPEGYANHRAESTADGPEQTGEPRARIVSWDYKESPDQDDLAQAVQYVSNGAIHCRSIDTDSDSYAVMFSTEPLSAAEALRLWLADSGYPQAQIDAIVASSVPAQAEAGQ